MGLAAVFNGESSGTIFCKSSRNSRSMGSNRNQFDPELASLKAFSSFLNCISAECLSIVNLKMRGVSSVFGG